MTTAPADVACRSCGSSWFTPTGSTVVCTDCGTQWTASTLAELPFTVSRPVCKAPPGRRCTIRSRRGYHMPRADKAVRSDDRRRYGRV